ncbi:response regulator [Leptothoe sp. PORK10 BA2]|uniref:response regulator n=1 Tax=Leptothoe sp. PORK10 BA2 TaxID=3110254 RepID=UPI002B216608|nr:response regulator [Leptothoe sp. PORK10 BA2]MEA5465452.1 response regulator [Leptothoe sp. PORK10 BA2]
MAASHKILVIDDSRVIRMRVRDMLPQGNFEVVEATDGVEGLDAIRNQKPNLIMLDFLLPRMSGWEVFQAIQASPELQKIPLVLMSGRREEVTEKIQGPFEYFEFIQKPFEQKELIDAIKASMVKARKVRPQTTTAAVASAPVATPAPASSDSSAEIAALKQQVATLQKEVAMLKNQTAKILAFIKQKLR